MRDEEIFTGINIGQLIFGILATYHKRSDQLSVLLIDFVGISAIPVIRIPAPLLNDGAFLEIGFKKLKTHLI